MKIFNQYCLNQHNFIAHQAIEQAIHAANDHFPEANLTPPSGIPPLNCWIYLETTNPKYRHKVSFILNEVENRAGARYPVAVVHCFKEGGVSFTANPAWELFQGQPATVSTTLKPTATPPPPQQCPDCQKPHHGAYPTCYYCHVHGQYERASFRQHPYLKNKQIPPEVAQSLGCRVFGGKLIIPLSGTQGYQVILPHGEKRYAVQQGLQQAHVVVGELGSTLYVAEGIATAVSAHLATGQGVIAALDLNGLRRTVERLRHESPQATITILADNDRKLGRTDNPGVDTAMRLAQRHGCAVAVPNWPDFRPSEGREFPKKPQDLTNFLNWSLDFNDLYIQHGAEAVKKQVDSAKLVEPEPTEWAKIVNQIVPTDTFISLARWELTEGQYLPYDLLTPYLDQDLRQTSENRRLSLSKPTSASSVCVSPVKVEHTLIGLKSPMGTGKTRAGLKAALAYAYKHGLTFGYSAHLQSLVKNAATELGIAAHIDFDSLDRLKDKPFLGFCTNGFTNKLWQPSDDKDHYDVLVLDEVEQQLQAIVTGTVKQKIKTYDAMMKQVHQAKIAIIMDADLSPETLQRFRRGYEGRLVVIENPLENWFGREVILSDAPKLLSLAHETLLEDGKVLLPCASKKVAQALFRKLTRDHPTKDIRLITQDTAKQHQPFIQDPNHILESERPDCIIHTSVIGSGFSIDLPGYFDTCLFMGGKNLTVEASLQMMGRYRHWQTFYCDIPTVGLYREEGSYEYFRQEIISKAEAELNSLEYVDVSNIQINCDHEFYDLHAEVRFKANESRRNLKGNFIQKTQELGGILKLTEKSRLADYRKTRQAISESLLEYEKERAEKTMQLHAANPMDEVEAKKYENSRLMRGGDDDLRYRAFDYERFYKEAVNIEGLLEDYYGERQEKIKRYERILGNEIEIEQRAKQNLDEATLGSGKIDATQVEGIAIHYKLTHKLLQALGFSFDADNEGLLNAESVERFSKVELINNTALMSFIDENREAINAGGLGFTVTENTLKSPVKFVGLVLKSIGVKLQSRRSGAKRYKVVDLEGLTRLNAVVKRRRGRDRLASVETKDNSLSSHEPARISYVEAIEGTIYAFDEAGNGTIVGPAPPD